MSEVMQEEAELPVLDTPETPVLRSVGDSLKTAREAKGATVAEIAQSMKLSPRQVEALESGNWQGLPGTTFIRGFVRNYARLVGIDAAPLLAVLDGQLGEIKPRLEIPPSMPTTMAMSGTADRRDYVFAIVGLGFVVAAVLVYLLLPNDLSSLRESLKGLIANSSSSQSAPAVSPSSAEAVLPPGASVQEVINPQAASDVSAAPVVQDQLVPPAENKSSDQPKTADSPKVLGNVPLVISFSKESWVEVRDRNGNVLLSQRVPANAERQVDGNGPFAIVLGNAPGVSIKFKGQPVDLTPYTKGDVARLTLE